MEQRCGEEGRPEQGRCRGVHRCSSRRAVLHAEGSTERQSLGKKAFTTKTTEGGVSYQIYEGDGAYTGNDIHRNLYLTWKVPYADGTITAEAYNAKGEKIDTSTWQGRQSVTTTGKAAKLKAEVNREGMTANGTDLAYVTVSVTDAEATSFPTRPTT